MKSSIRFVLVCYGANIGYAHGAKYQIARGYREYFFDTQSAITVVTDRPELFKQYPVDLVTLDEFSKAEWSFGHKYHFGIKNRALAAVIDRSTEDVFLQVDTDTYWKKSPLSLAAQISDSSMILKFDEGPVIGSKNRSISRFEEALTDRPIRYGAETYTLGQASRMWNSGLIGMHRTTRKVLDEAYLFIEAIHSEVSAHTAEQFALGEVCRLKGITIHSARTHLGDWSSIGRKDYFTPELAAFFREHGEDDFTAHVAHVGRLKPYRPFGVFVKQKVARIIRKFGVN